MFQARAFSFLCLLGGSQAAAPQRRAEQEALVEEVNSLAWQRTVHHSPPPTRTGNPEVGVGLEGAKSRSQEPTAGALCGGLGPGLTEGQGMEQQDTTVEEALPGREGTSQGGPKPWPALLSASLAHREAPFQHLCTCHPSKEDLTTCCAEPGRGGRAS